MPRKTPRPPDEARAIARNLRRRYITAEAEATAKAAMTRLEAGRAAKGAKPAQPLDALRQREQISVPAESGAPFSDEEKARAKAILDRLHMAYPRNS
jgi:hypothetical protein